MDSSSKKTPIIQNTWEMRHTWGFTMRKSITWGLHGVLYGEWDFTWGNPM